MSDTPRVDSYVYKFPGCQREPRLIDFARQLEREIAEARAEIERQTDRIMSDACIISTAALAIAERDKLVAQMRDALKALRSYTDSVLQKKDSNAEMRRVAKLCDDAEANAALSAAERATK